MLRCGRRCRGAERYRRFLLLMSRACARPGDLAYLSLAERPSFLHFPRPRSYADAQTDQRPDSTYDYCWFHEFRT
jgi:hypothetical protein